VAKPSTWYRAALSSLQPAFTLRARAGWRERVCSAPRLKKVTLTHCRISSPRHVARFFTVTLFRFFADFAPFSVADKIEESKTKQNKTKQNKTKQNKTKQNKTKQNKTKQIKQNKQNKTKQNKQNKTKKAEG
jgi:hypothetical protein